MAINPATNKQVPDHSIMDLNGKQAYLANAYSVSANFTVGSSETPLILIMNNQSGNQQNLKALFHNLLKLSENTASKSCILNVYLNPTVSADAQQTVTVRADVVGNLNSTYWTFYMPGGQGYYVWYNINSAGVDPAPAGLIGIAVAGATNISQANVAIATQNAINTAAIGVTATHSATAVIMTNTVPGPVIPAADSSGAATSFTFVVNASEGSLLVPVNLRPAYGVASIVAQLTQNPVVSANGTLIDSISAGPQAVSMSSLLKILDNGQSLLITSVASASSTVINVISQHYEL